MRLLHSRGDTWPLSHFSQALALYHYVACRLVLEGGFLPDDITPHPPFRAQKGDGWQLTYDADIATGSELTLLGGLKTKSVDVVIIKNRIGPALAVSCKGAIGAFRNLTNRMEEAVGDCTNLHITYFAMVTGFLCVLRAHRQEALIAATAAQPEAPPTPGRAIGQNDIAIQQSGEPVEAIVRFHNALRELTGRRGIRDDVSRYEAVSLVLIDPAGANAGQVLPNYPMSDSPLRLERFFETVYLRYDERYVYSAPELASVTRRREWSASSPVFDKSLPEFPSGGLGYQPRLETPGASHDSEEP
jgi:hypothetical protein